MKGISYFFRKKQPDFNSIEEVFNILIEELNDKITQSVIHLPENRFSFTSILNNIVWASKRKGEINHITGHINYIALGLGKNTILTIHDIGSAFSHNIIKNFILKLILFWLPALVVKKITVISKQSANEVSKLIPFAKKKITVIPNPINPQIRYFEKQFNKNCPTILQIGTKQNKNLERTIEALSTINCHLVIVGKLTEIQEKLLTQYGVFPTPSQSNPQAINPNPEPETRNPEPSTYTNLFNISFAHIIELYQQCDLVCFTSTYEGFGMPIVEAQATGRPVVTSNISSMPEVAGEAACFVDPFSVESIRKGVLKVICDDSYRENLIQKGLENIKRFEAKKIVDQYLALYIKIKNS